MNMVRAGVVTHPADWDGGAWGELSGAWPRDGVIDHERLRQCLACATEKECREWYRRTLDALCRRGQPAREPVWTAAAAVGGRTWIERLADRLPESWRTITTVAPNAGTYALRVSNRCREGILRIVRP
jgi:hypothetical protein